MAVRQGFILVKEVSWYKFCLLLMFRNIQLDICSLKHNITHILYIKLQLPIVVTQSFLVCFLFSFQFFLQLSYISLAWLIVPYFSHMFKNATFYPGRMALQNWQKTENWFIPAYSIPPPYPLIVMQNAGLHNPSLVKISTFKRVNKPLRSL